MCEVISQPVAADTTANLAYRSVSNDRADEWISGRVSFTLVDSYRFPNNADHNHGVVDPYENYPKFHSGSGFSQYTKFI